MFNQLMSAVSRLQPGDQMKMHFQRAKPTWLEGSQKGQGATQPAGSGLNTGSGMTPPPAPAEQAAMPPAPMASPDQTAQNQMLIQRMQQMGPSGYGGY